MEFNMTQATEALLSAFRLSRMTQKELSQISDVPETSIQKLFAGDIREPRFENFARLAKALNLSVDDVIGISSNSEVESLRRENELLRARTEAAEANERAAKAETAAKDIVIDEKEMSNNRLYKSVIVIGFLFVILVFAIVGILVYDITHQDRGWFQSAAAYYYTGIGWIRDFFL